MFKAASSCFVEAVGSGAYLPLESVEDAHNCKLLGIAVKKKYRLKADKYVLTDITLQDILKRPKKGLSMICFL